MDRERQPLLEQFRITKLPPEGGRGGQRRHTLWIVMLEGRRPEDVLFLQAKEAESSVLERFTKKSTQEQPRGPASWPASV